MTKHIYEGELLGFNQNLYLDDTAQTLFALIADKIAPTITSDGMGPDCHHFGRVRITVEQTRGERVIRSIPVVLGELEETFDEEGRPTGFAVLTIDSSLHGPTEVVGLSLSNATSSQHLKVSFSSTAPGVKTCIPFLAHEIDRALFGPVCVTVEQLESDSG